MKALCRYALLQNRASLQRTTNMQLATVSVRRLLQEGRQDPQSLPSDINHCDLISIPSLYHLPPYISERNIDAYSMIQKYSP